MEIAEGTVEPLETTGIIRDSSGDRVPSARRSLGTGVTLASSGKSSLLAALSALTGRHAILLPRDASAAPTTLQVASPYRVRPPCLTVNVLEPSPGILTVSLLAYDGHFPRRLVWECQDIQYSGPATFALGITTGTVAFADTTLGNIDLPLPTRRFAIRLKLKLPDGSELSRTTGHYLPAASDLVGESYYQGDDYVDYEAQARGEAADVLKLLDNHGAADPVLEVGSATGVILEKLRNAGRNVTGVDFSGWAVGQAARRLGTDKVFQANVEIDELPPAVASRGPFATLLLWAVLEHFHDPFSVLAKLAPHMTADATLIVNTTNAASLSHHLFGDDWEGYFDWTHHGVDKVSVESLRNELPRLGWNIEELYTHSFWHVGADPDHAVLRDTFAYDARFGRLLRSHGLGDFLICVARRRR